MRTFSLSRTTPVKVGSGRRPGGAGRRATPTSARIGLLLAVSCLLPAPAAAAPLQGESGDASRLRRAIMQRVGSLEALRVPPTDAGLPQPRRPDRSIDPRFAITEAKRYLGKLLFHDPVRTTDIRPEFGGVPATAQTASCGSCHLGGAAAKAGILVNLAVGGEGLGYRDPAVGRLTPRRRISAGLVDLVPTPLEVFVGGQLVRSGRFDPVDSVPRLSPTTLGFAFNTRLLLDGAAGEPNGPGKANKNPDDLPAGENLAQIAFGAHRMADTQAAALKAIPAYVRLFRDAFPDEAAAADAASNLDLLINDHTAARAVAAFLRTAVTRNTPWDRFLAGDERMLTPRQMHGALLFMTPATEGGAGCIACHSGPMLNKTLGDEAGTGVESNFHNIGAPEHPLQELARSALGDPRHRDAGRSDVTGDAAGRFRFKSPTLRQVRDGGQFTHGGAFGSVREVVEYFNAGIPADAEAAAAGTLSPLFGRPRGAGYPSGLGLNAAAIKALVDFLEDGLYDPGFADDDPLSTTRAFDPTPRDLAYSVYRPDLAALGAIDGLMPSGRPAISNDPLTRRDLGLELLDVTGRARITRSVAPADTPARSGLPAVHVERLTLYNDGTEPIDTDLMVILKGLPASARLMNRDGVTLSLPSPALPYRRLFLQGGAIRPGDSVELHLRFAGPPHMRLDYSVVLLSGNRTP